jgi:hAT family C-terminal dimerisation region
MIKICVEKHNADKNSTNAQKSGTNNPGPCLSLPLIPGQESSPGPTPYFFKLIFDSDVDIWAEEDENSPEPGSDSADMAMIRRKVNSELSEYMLHPRLQRQRIDRNYDIVDFTDPLLWWKTRIWKYPILSIIAKRFLCVPAYATKENNFSVNGATQSKNREMIDSENGCAVVYVRDNWDLSLKLRANPEQ